MRILEIAKSVLKDKYLCDRCLGRIFGQLLSGMSNEERGKAIRTFLAMALDSGESLELHPSNFHGISFRNVKIVTQKEKCWLCENFFEEELERVLKKVLKKLGEFEFDTFLVGCRLRKEMIAREEELWEETGIEFVETLKNEINREIGKRLSTLLGKKMDRKNPDITILVNLETGGISLIVKSLFIFGKYQKLVRGIPQAKWICGSCGGKGCKVCKGRGKLYSTSVQEIIEKPFLKVTKAKKSRFHAAGREDIDARCLDWRPFVIEIVKPRKRTLNLRKILKEINKSKKVKVKGLKFVEKHLIKVLKSMKNDKTYEVLVTFTKPVNEEELKKLKMLEGATIEQRTPIRVLHRRKDKLRRRRVKKISWKILSKRRVLFKIRAEAGLYIKELITGDDGRTKPSVCEILQNKAIKILLDVVKIHSA